MSMASVSEKSSNDSVAGGTVAGYFARGEDARRAIDELMDQGFDVREIGAAFHSRVRRGSMLDAEEAPSRRAAGSDSVAGVASGSGGVTPSGLSTGGGTGIEGAHKPGPITGGEIPSDLPTEIPSELPTDAEVRADRKRQEAFYAGRPASASTNEDGRSWRERLETVFERRSGTGQTAADQKFGTGEGHLGDIADYAYSSSAFEQSFTGLGIPPDHAMRVAQELRRGGAVVTVKAAARSREAESILLRNHGIIRYETPAPRREPRGASDDEEARMEIFGEMHRVYPNYVPRDRQIGRKAS